MSLVIGIVMFILCHVFSSQTGPYIYKEHDICLLSKAALPFAVCVCGTIKEKEGKERK